MTSSWKSEWWAETIIRGSPMITWIALVTFQAASQAVSDFPPPPSPASPTSSSKDKVSGDASGEGEVKLRATVAPLDYGTKIRSFWDMNNSLSLEWAVRANERMDERVAQYYSLYSWLFSTVVLFFSAFSSPINSMSRWKMGDLKSRKEDLEETDSYPGWRNFLGAFSNF